MKKYILSVITLFLVFSLYGCYTQVDFRNRHNDDTEYRDRGNDDGYYQNDNDSNSNSDDGSDVTINNYYSGYYPGYHRYFWHSYYPSFNVDFCYGPTFWDPFYYDPWWYYPGIPVIAYYSPYYYNDYYYGGYSNYGNYWNGGSVYKERTNSGLRLRNNDGGRGVTLRDRTTRNLIQTSISREASRTDNLRREVLRTATERGNVHDIPSRRDREITPADRPNRGTIDNSSVNDRRTTEQPADRNTGTIKRERIPESRDEARPQKPQRNSESTSPKRDERRRESYSIPRRESSSPSYQSPRSSGGSSPRSSSSSSSRGNSGGGGSRDRRR